MSTAGTARPIVFCGYANLDVVGRVPRFPAPDERVHATAIDQLPGGMGANAAVAAARAGADAAFAGVVGADLPSDLFLAQLDAEGVDTSWTDRAGWLSTAIVLVDGEGRRSVVSQDDALDGAHVGRVADRLATAGGGLLYLDGYRAAELPHAVRPGVQLAVDLDGCEDPALARTALATADHVVVGRQRLTGLLGLDPSVAGPRTTLVVTDGPRGWTLTGPDGAADGPALAVDVVDDTGAGDCFVGTHLAGLAAGLDPVRAATRAAVAASLSCTREGARAAPGPAEVTAALERATTRTA
ncbi:carbohydrate kinase family protein [Modestobacter sp. Leaf380]|uniref:carbohydrate kinase family protein n=1 Tax=Modestobacter sp. Leaf380 TaxID=1736356 RepID=UPI00138F38C1|nr:carbohydrate kinase family protein [Modestobacter sp. Leaf380]